MSHRESGAECVRVCVCVCACVCVFERERKYRNRGIGSAREWKKEKKFEWLRRSI